MEYKSKLVCMINLRNKKKTKYIHPQSQRHKTTSEQIDLQKWEWFLVINILRKIYLLTYCNFKSKINYFNTYNKNISRNILFSDIHRISFAITYSL